MNEKQTAIDLFDKCYNKIENATAGLFEEDVDYITARRLSAKECTLIIAEMCYKEAYKQGNEIANIRQDFWSNVTAEIHRM